MARTVGALIAGFFVTAWGRKRSLIGFGLLRSLALCIYLLPAFGITNLPVLYLAAGGLNFSQSMANTAIFTIIMDKSELEAAGTDFTVQNSVISFTGMAASALSGAIAGAIGYRGVFALSIVLALLGVAIIAKVFHENRSQPKIPSVSTQTY